MPFQSANIYQNVGIGIREHAHTLLTLVSNRTRRQGGIKAKAISPTHTSGGCNQCSVKVQHCF